MKPGFHTDLEHLQTGEEMEWDQTIKRHAIVCEVLRGVGEATVLVTDHSSVGATG